MIIMVVGAMGIGKTTFCKKFSTDHGYTYVKCQLNSEDKINKFNVNENFIIDGGLFKEKSYGMTVGNIKVPHEIWGLFAPPKVVLERYYGKPIDHNMEYSEKEVKLVQSKLINIVDKAVWNI